MAGGVPPSWLGPGRTLMPSKSSVFSLSPDEDMSYLTLSYASVIPTKLVKSDAPSVRFAIMENPGDEPIEGTFPFVARFEAINDVVMIALKQTKNITSYRAVTRCGECVRKLIFHPVVGPVIHC